MTADPTTATHDALIIAVAKTRDRTAFAALFTHFAPRVKAYLQKTGMTAMAAEDMMQDVLLTVWHKAGQFDPARASAPAWIYGIARHLRIDAQRRGRLVIPAGDPTDDAPPVLQADALVAAAERACSVRQAIATLPAEQVTILRLAFFDGLSQSEIEQKLAVPLGTIKSRLRLAMAKLRLALKEAP